MGICLYWCLIEILNLNNMTVPSIEQQVMSMVENMRVQGQEAVAVMLGHEDWLLFSSQSKVAYTHFWQCTPLSACIVKFIISTRG